MPVYRYTFKKFCKHKSTWIIILIAFLFGLLVVGVLFFRNFIKYADVTPTEYLNLTMSIYGSIALLFSFFGAIFTSFVGSKVIKDEIEDGTFLVVLSKPITRGRIIFEKWLAYATMLAIFSFTTAFSVAIAALLFDNPIKSNPNYSEIVDLSVKKNILQIFPIIFAIGFLISFIFSSIALMISTKLSVGATIGITSSIGVIVPLTGLIGQFTNKTTHSESFVASPDLSTSSTSLFLQRWIKPEQNRIKPGEITLPFKVDGATVTFTLKGQPNESSQTEDLNTLAEIYSLGFAHYLTSNDNSDGSTGPTNMGIKNGETDVFQYLSYVDLSYQINQLGSIASDQIISGDRIAKTEAARALNATKGRNRAIYRQQVVSQYDSSQITHSMDSLQNNALDFANKYMLDYVNNWSTIEPNLPDLLFGLDKFIEPSELQQIAESIFPTTSQSGGSFEGYKNAVNSVSNDQEKVKIGMNYFAQYGKLDQLKYVDYLSKNSVLIFYFCLAGVLVPLSYWIVRRQDYA